ncbi:hypothetical protein C1H46_004701 [Malus baccata]|uniref:Uncharacterized protein n=1 Tax=Malus baccata TaxID=106549 RepID=A0A540NFB3_MALBA|nr:hypothetical protein C1H46_004701 [Malus baccata]
MYKFSAPRFFGFSLSYIKDENDDDKHKAESELSTAGGMAIHVDLMRDGGGSSDKRGLEEETMVGSKEQERIWLTEICN